MSDIRYKWNDGLNSVQVSGDVSLPQFKVIHRSWYGMPKVFEDQNIYQSACTKLWDNCKIWIQNIV